MSHSIDTISVGVVVPWGKREGIYRCIDSVLYQSRQVENIVVVANGSVDITTFEACETRYAEQHNVHFIMLTGCENANIARNIGLLSLDTDTVAFLDSDDWWDTSHIEESITKLIRSNSDLVYSGMRILRKNSTEEKFASDYREERGMRNYCLSYFAAPTSSLIAYRSKALEIMWDWKLRRHQDYDFKARFCDRHTASCKSTITVNIDWSDNKRNVVYADCFHLLRSWKGKADPFLYKRHYINLTRGALLANDNIFWKKILISLFYVLQLLPRKLKKYL